MSTDISKAYAALHEKWPELRPRPYPESVGKYGPDDYFVFHYYKERWVMNHAGATDPNGWVGDAIPDAIAHAACFLACLKACGKREFDVNFRQEWDKPKFYNISGGIVVDIDKPHTITEVMDKVMVLPKAKP